MIFVISKQKKNIIYLVIGRLIMKTCLKMKVKSKKVMMMITYQAQLTTATYVVTEPCILTMWHTTMEKLIV